MGIGQITADYYYENSPFPEFPVCGLVTTHPVGEKWITDTAASATAIATGVKTQTGAVSMSKEGEKLTTVLEIAKDIGKSTGIVVTTSITQPTPACFISHFEEWGKEYQIAIQESQSSVDVLFGGGLRFFTNNTVLDSNLIEGMVKQGYEFVSNQSQLETLDTEKEDKIIGLFAYEAMKRADLRNLSLSLMTRKAIEILDNSKKGFFLMVEGSQIDWRCHERDKNGFLVEIKDFTNAIKWAFEYQKSNPDVLIVVCSDHETGGLCLVKDSNARGKARIKFASRNHTANICPVFAKGRGQDNFTGFHDISDIGKILLKLVK